MSLQFISNSVLRGDASFSTGSAALFQSSGNNTTSDTWIYNSGSLANGYQLDFGHGIVRTSANIIMSLKDENVGIGETSPLAKLQITTPFTSSPSDSIFLFTNGSNTPGGGSEIIFGSSTSATPTIYNAKIAGVRSSLDNGSSDLWFQTTHVATSTSPSTKMIIKSDGKVGIGVTSPSSKLTIETNAGDGTIELLAVNAATTKNKIIFSEAILGDESFFIEHDGAGAGVDNLLKIHGDGSGGTASGITIRRDGRVGIGTDSPDYKFEVEGVISSADSALQKATFANVGTDLVLTANADATNVTAKMLFNSSGAGGGAVSTKMIIDGSGNVGIGTTAPGNKLHVNGGEIQVVNGTSGKLLLQNSTNYLYGDQNGVGILNANDNLRLYTVGSERMRISSAGAIKFNAYDSTNNTGTPTYILGTDASGNVVKVLGSNIPGGGGTVTGTGIAEYIPKWNSTSALANSKAFQSTASSITTFNIGTAALTCDFLNYHDSTGAITGKVPVIEAKAALIGIGAQDKVYTSIYEGIKIIPATSHYLTRITPRLEVYPYEDPSTTTDNTYDSSFVGSCFSMGSQNTIGDSTSSNLGIFGFNNTITGDKFVIIGQGNVLGKANVSSLAVGTTNTISGNGKLVNSLLVGQNMTLTQAATRSIVAGINHSFQGAMNNTVIVGSGNQGFGSNNFIWGSSNQGSGVNNIMLGGFSTQIISSTGNRYGSALMGWNNTLQASTRATFITGRDNIIVDTDYSIMGGFNNDTSANHSSLLVGTKNYGRGTGNITGGEQNTHESNTNNYNLMVGFKNKTYQTGTNSLIAGSTNEIGSANNLVVGQNNKVQSDTKNNIVGGNSNDILSQVATGQFNENNILSGLRNNIYIGSNNIVNGLQNDIGINSNSNSKVSHSIVIGSNNNVGNQAAGTIANKSNMAVFGATNDVRGNNAFVAGSNNGCFTDNAIILGNNNSAGGVSAGEAKVIQIGFSIQPNSQSDYLAIGYGMSALPTTAVDSQNVANKYTAIGRNPDNNVDYDLSSLDPVSFIVGAGTQQNYRRTAIAVTCKNSTSEESNVILPGVGKYRNYTNDTTAAAGGVPLYGLYHTSGTIKIRIA